MLNKYPMNEYNNNSYLQLGISHVKMFNSLIFHWPLPSELEDLQE